MQVPLANVQFDMSMARGLDYYTGVIFEVVLRRGGKDGETEDVGSVAGGGRYDKLVGMFSNKQIPCVGISLGVERLLTVVLRLREQELSRSETLVLVAGMDDSKLDSLPVRMKLCAEFWAGGIRAEFQQGKKKQKLVDHFSRCEADKIPILVYFGSSEVEQGIVKVRQMFHSRVDTQGRVERVEKECSRQHVVSDVQQMLMEMGLITRQ